MMNRNSKRRRRLCFYKIFRDRNCRHSVV